MKSSIYTLKKFYGKVAYYYRENNITQDIKTGVIKRDYQKFHIKRTIIASTTEARKLLGTQGNFGNDFDVTNRVAIIDAKDLPKNFKPSENDVIVYLNRKYKIDKFLFMEENNVYVMSITSVTSTDEIIDRL